MKTVQDLLDENNRELIKIDPNQTVFEALTMLSKYDIGALVVMNGEILSGIFSERDYARKVILSGKSSKETFVKEIMTEKVKCISPQNNIEDCMKIMTESRFRHLPVLKDDKVLGIISIGDIVRETITYQKFIINQLEQYISG
ncbi:MAG: CBS domain-containing protein [Hydrogenophilales bacterium]